MRNGHEPREGEETRVFGSFVDRCWFQNVKQVMQIHIPLVEAFLISTFCNQQILDQ